VRRERVADLDDPGDELGLEQLGLGFGQRRRPNES
jgi:hypothetical protein